MKDPQRKYLAKKIAEREKREGEMYMNLEEKTVKQNTLYKGRILTLRNDRVLLPNGKVSYREVVEHPGGVCVVPLCDNGDVLFVRQFRYPYGAVIPEIPAGKLSPGEDPLACGVRELKEETGAVAEKYTPLGELYPSPGYCGEIIYMYLAEGLSFEEQQLDEDEFLSVERVPILEAVQSILNGAVKDAKTQAAILKTAALKQLFCKKNAIFPGDSV